MRALAWLRSPGAFEAEVRESQDLVCGPACEPKELAFSRPEASTTNSLIPDVDNAYLAAEVTPQAGEVAVVRGLAPVSPSTVGEGTSPTRWPRPRWDVRYRSMCSNVWTAP